MDKINEAEWIEFSLKFENGDFKEPTIDEVKHIIKCVNEHDNLVAEVEVLKNKCSNLRKTFDSEAERLRELITQHIKWNKAHTKVRVELTEEVERLKKENALLRAEIWDLEKKSK